MSSQTNSNPSERKKENFAPPTASHSNTMLGFLMKISDAYNNDQVDENARQRALAGLDGSLRSEKKVGQTREEDKMLAGIMVGLVVKKDDEKKDMDN